MQTYLELRLRKLSQYWRDTAQKNRDLTDEAALDAMRAHMHGVSDGLVVAADDVDDLLDTNETQKPN